MAEALREVKVKVASRAWKDSKSGVEYSLDHLDSFVAAYPVKLETDAEPTEVPVRIIFSNHCYTRKRESGDPDHLVVAGPEAHKDGTVEERVFCVARWEFSRQLPEVLSELQYKQCFQGGQREVFYRLEGSNIKNRDAGWYICMRFDYRKDNEVKHRLQVRSAHYRPNRPNDIRGSGSQRFYVLLAQEVKRKLKSDRK